MTRRFLCIEVRAADATGAERVAAAVHDAGASGLEEREDSSGIRLLVYLPESAWDGVQAALAGEADAHLGVGTPEPVEEVDWSREWRRGLAPVVVSPRLAVVPEGVPFTATPGQTVLRIEPAQAFGTGAHASTFLALEGLDALGADVLRGTHWVDVGSGSGVLALAALRLGVRRVDAFDCDPIAARATRENAVANGIVRGLHVFCGRSDALGGPPRDGVVANLLRRELLPCLSDLARCVRPGGRLVLAGLLATEQAEVAAALAAAGFDAPEASVRTDATGDSWLGLVTRRAA